MSEGVSTPRVTVGMPVRNGEVGVESAIRSVLDQDLTDLRLVVADNGSTDGTSSIVARLAETDPRILYVRFDDVVDAAASFNRLLNWATTDYFIWIAHDDVWEPSLLARLVEALDASPWAALAFPAVDLVDADLQPVREFASITALARPQARWRRLGAFILLREDSGKANIVHGLIRADVARQSAGFRAYTEGGWGQDYHLVYRFLAMGTFTNDSSVVFHKRISRPDPLPPLGERLGYLVAYLRMAGELRLSPFECVAVAGAVLLSAIRVLRERIGLHFSITHALRSTARRFALTRSSK